MNAPDRDPSPDPHVDPEPDPDLDAELDAATDSLGPSLRALLEPPGDIERRTADVVDRSLRGRSAVNLGLDLVGLGWWTLRTILTDDPPPADGEGEGNDDDE